MQSQSNWAKFEFLVGLRTHQGFNLNRYLFVLAKDNIVVDTEQWLAYLFLDNMELISQIRKEVISWNYWEIKALEMGHELAVKDKIYEVQVHKYENREDELVNIEDDHVQKIFTYRRQLGNTIKKISVSRAWVKYSEQDLGREGNMETS